MVLTPGPLTSDRNVFMFHKLLAGVFSAFGSVPTMMPPRLKPTPSW